MPQNGSAGSESSVYRKGSIARPDARPAQSLPGAASGPDMPGAASTQGLPGTASTPDMPGASSESDLPGAGAEPGFSGTAPAQGLTGVVLAGGASSRLGRDKALLRLPGGGRADMLARSVALLCGLCDRILVVGRRQPGYECLEDAVPGCGPAGGIATALAEAKSACLVLSCDMPFMERHVLERLIAFRAASRFSALCHAYCQQDTGHMEALVAIYEAPSLPLFKRCLSEGLLKVSRVVPPERRNLLPYTAEESLPFFNINYPADLELARRVMRSLGRG